MLTSPIRRKILLLLCIAAALAPVWPSSASAAAAQGERIHVLKAERATPELLDRLWTLLGFRVNVRCDGDARGQCAGKPQKSPPQLKEGCHIDPLGRCLP
jgi:hypothetical protein